MNTHPHDNDGQPGTVYILHFEPAYRHARHYVGWALDPDARIAAHLAGNASPLVRAAVAAGVHISVAALLPGSRHLERRLKTWHKTGQFCQPAAPRAAAAHARTRGRIHRGDAGHVPSRRAPRARPTSPHVAAGPHIAGTHRCQHVTRPFRPRPERPPGTRPHGGLSISRGRAPFPQRCRSERCSARLYGAAGADLSAASGRSASWPPAWCVGNGSRTSGPAT